MMQYFLQSCCTCSYLWRSRSRSLENGDAVKRPMKDDHPGSGKFEPKHAQGSNSDAEETANSSHNSSYDNLPGSEIIPSETNDSPPKHGDLNPDLDPGCHDQQIGFQNVSDHNSLEESIKRHFDLVSEQLKIVPHDPDSDPKSIKQPIRVLPDHQYDNQPFTTVQTDQVSNQPTDPVSDQPNGADLDSDSDPHNLDQPIMVEIESHDEKSDSKYHMYDNVFINAKLSYMADESDSDNVSEYDEPYTDVDAAPPIQFEPEEKKVKGFQDEEAMSNEDALSTKEQLSKELQEKDVEEVDETEDSIGDLDAVAAVIKKKAKDLRRHKGEETDLDFSVIQRTQNLNVEASKQRVQLRQKGSLAQRRRPTRNSMRHKSSSEDDFYEDSTEPRQSQMNGDYDNEEEEEYFRPQRRKEEEEEGTTGVVLRTGKTIQGIKTPILLPGLGEGRAKLRSKPVAHIPNNTEPKPESEAPSPPAWLLEARKRRVSRPPKGETEKTQTEREPETPSWMKDVLAKKQKRVLGMMPKQEVQEQGEKDEQPAAPWMKEAHLRKVNRPSPLKATHKDITNNNATNTAPYTNSINGHSMSEKELIITNDITVSKKENGVIGGKEMLTPIKRSSVDRTSMSQETDENTPPPGLRDSVFVDPEEGGVMKSALPPLKPCPSVTSPTSDSNEESVPAWKAEIAARRRSRTFIPTQRPEQPIRLGETPDWKKQLAEKNKQRRESGTSKEFTRSPSSSSEPASPSVPQWKQELAQRKKRLSSSPKVPEHTEVTKVVEEPEWAKQVERRRQRLARFGSASSDADEPGVGLIKAYEETS